MGDAQTKKSQIKMPTPCGWGVHEEVDINFIAPNGMSDQVAEYVWQTDSWAYILPPQRHWFAEGRC